MVQRGPNAVVANRPLSDQDYYGLRPVELVLPAPGHRIPALRKLTDKADKGKITNSESAGTPLGTIGTIGFVWSIGAVLALGLGARARKESTRFVAQLGVLNVTAILIGAIGGFAFLLALAGFGTYRTWNRISLFIAFVSLIAVGFLLDRMFGFISKRFSTTSKVVGIVIAGLVVFLLALGGALDQITPRYVMNYEKTATRFDLDATFYHDLEKSVPKSSMMFQLPLEVFPEAGTIAQMSDYQDFTGYLHTKNLRWNYAGMKGRREGDWQQNLSIFDPVATVGEIAATGFQGIVVDRSGFTDRAESFLRAVEPYVGAPVLKSQDDRLLYLDLTGLRGKLDAQLGKGAVAQDAQVVLGDAIHWTGFSFPEPVCGGTRRWATSRTGTVELENTTKAPITVTASTSFEANPDAKAIKVHAPGVSDTVVLTNGTGRFERQLTLPPGASQIQFTLVGPGVVAPNDARTLQFSLVNYSFGGPFASPIVAWAHSLEPSCSATP